MTKYIEIAATEVPAAVRFDVPQRNQGQIIEIAYGGYSRSEHDAGDPYRRTTDRSTGVVTYARRAATGGLAVRP